jgi:hypothetical protein
MAVTLVLRVPSAGRSIKAGQDAVVQAVNLAVVQDGASAPPNPSGNPLLFVRLGKICSAIERASFVKLDAVSLPRRASLMSVRALECELTRAGTAHFNAAVLGCMGGGGGGGGGAEGTESPSMPTISFVTGP